VNSRPPATDGGLRRRWRDIGLAALLIMEVSWLVPWLRFFLPATLRIGTLGLLLAMAVLAWAVMGFARLLDNLRVMGVPRAAALAAGVLLCWYLALRGVLFPESSISLPRMLQLTFEAFAQAANLIPAELIVMASVLFIWRRGVVAASQSIMSVHSTHLEFRLGILSLAAFALLLRRDYSGLALEVMPFYFVSGLLAIALSRTDEISGTGRWQRPLFDRFWLAAFGGMVVLVVLLGEGTGRLMAGPLGFGLFDGLEKAAIYLAGLIGLLISPVLLLVVYGLQALIGLLRAPLDPAGALESLRSALSQLMVNLPAPSTNSLSWIAPYRRQLAIAGSLAGLAVLTWAALRSVKTQRPAPDPGPELAAEHAGLQAAGRGGVRRAVNWRPWRRLAGIASQVFSELTIRRIYRNLLRKAAGRGIRRQAAQTPLEFLPALISKFPAFAAEVTEITQAYLQVHYGEMADHQAGLESVQDSWRRIQRGSGGGD
jgi:hypothetical protein